MANFKNKIEIVPPWAYDTVEVLLNSLKSVDFSTYEHCLRVGELSRLLTKQLNFSSLDQSKAFISGLLHDIGKMGINKAILLKTASLDEDEFSVMKHHSILSESILQPLAQHSFFKDVIPVVRAHHERIDGKGYPDRKAGDEIPELAKILTICDAFDAMTQTRVYRQGMPLESVFEEMRRCAGTQFHLEYVEIFIKNYPLWIQQMSLDLSQDLSYRCVA